MYDVYKLMRIFGLGHPSQVLLLPAHFADWSLMFDRVEQSVAEEKEFDRLRMLAQALWGGG